MESDATEASKVKKVDPEALQAFSRMLRASSGVRFGPGSDEQIFTRVLNFFQIAPGKAPSPEVFTKWWQGEAFPAWQQAVQLAILLGNTEDWLIFPDGKLPRYEDLARALFLAASRARKLPANTNLMTWLHDAIKAHGQSVTRMSLANWVTGHSVPNRRCRILLEDILGLRLGDLEQPGALVERLEPGRPRQSSSAGGETVAEERTPRKRSKSSAPLPLGKVLQKALESVAESAAAPHIQRRFLQKELMNRYVMDVGLVTIKGWLEGRIRPEPEELKALSEVLKIGDLTAVAAKKAKLTKTAQKKPAPAAAARKVAAPAGRKVSTSKPAKSKTVTSSPTSSERAAKPTLLAERLALAASLAPSPERKGPGAAVRGPRTATAAKKRPTSGSKRGRAAKKEGLEILQRFKNAQSGELTSLKKELRLQFGIRVNLADLREWMNGSAKPKPNQLEALTQILKA